MKRKNIYKGFSDWWPDEFSHSFACWAQNHRGWAKSKKRRNKLAKKRERDNFKKQIQDEINEECE